MNEERIVEVRPAQIEELRRSGEVHVNGVLLRFPERLDTSDVASLLGLDVTTVRKIVRRGDFPGWHAGTRVVFTRRSVLAWIRSRGDG